MYLDATLVGEAYARLRTCCGDGSIVVAGLGNIRRGDEAAGLHVVQRLAAEPKIPGVKLVIAGTRALRVLAELADARALILVLAACDHHAAGSVQYAAANGVLSLPPSLARNRWGLHDLLTTAALCGELPPVHLYTISIEAGAVMSSTSLSPAVEAGIAVATCMVHGHARRLTPRSHAA